MIGIEIGVTKPGSVSAPPTQADFLDLHSWNGNAPDYIADFDANLFWFNGVYYTSRAPYVAAGGPVQGTGFVPKAAIGSGAPYTVKVKATLPATINASRETLVMFRGSTNTNFASLRLDATTPSAQLRVTTAGTVYMGASGVQSPISSSLLGTPVTFSATFDNASGASDKKINVSNTGRAPVQNGAACTLSSLSTGMYIGWDPDNSGSFLRGTMNLVVAWGAKNHANGAVRALSTGVKYGGTTINVSGGGGDINLGNGYTWICRTGADGDPVIIEVLNSTGEVTKIRSITGTAMTQDDHLTPKGVAPTDAGGACLAVNPHDTGNVIYIATCPDLNLDNFTGRSAVTLGSGYIPAYNRLCKPSITNQLDDFYRTNQTFWNTSQSTDNGATWGASKRILDDSATHAADKLLIATKPIEISPGVYRLFANREPQYGNCDIRMFDYNSTTGDLSVNGVSIGTAGVGNGAPMLSCQQIWNPGAGFSAFVREMKSWNAGYFGLQDDATGLQSHYWGDCNSLGSPWSTAAWDKYKICDELAVGRGGGGCVIGIPGLTYPAVAMSRYYPSDGRYHLEIWQASSTAGSGWSIKSELASYDGSGDNELATPTSAVGAAAKVGVSYNIGTKASFTSWSELERHGQPLGLI